MKSLLDNKREVALWVGLFVALSASGILLSRRSPEKDQLTPVPERVQTVTARDSAVQGDSVRLVKPKIVSLLNVVRRPLAEQAPVAEQAAGRIGWSGGEMPFSVAEPVATGTPTTETDPVRLCAALVDAIADGKVMDASVLRAELLDIGSAAVPSIATLLNAGMTPIEIEAVRLLVQIGSTEALTSALAKMMTLSTTNPDYESYLAAFANSRNTAVMEWLTDFLGWAQTDEMRQRALRILGALRGPEVVKSLLRQLAKPADQMHADDCMITLVQVTNPEQVGALRDLLELGKSLETQELGAYGLASVGNAEAVGILLENGSSTEASALASRDALATVSSSYGQETLIQAAINPAVPSAVRCAAVQALSSQNGQRIETVLFNLGQSTSDLALQTAISQALQLAEQNWASQHSGSVADGAGIRGEMSF